MKSRAGFVSNSSSSSFIVNAESAFDIAKTMIPLREDGWEEANEKLLELVEDIQEKVDCESLRFRTCNFDTYIAKVGDKFVVETCNNHSLDRIDSKKGYVKGNVQWVHKTVNRLKMDLSEEELMYWCNLIVRSAK